MSSAGKEWRQYVIMARCLILWDIDGTLITTGVIGRRALEGGAAEAAGLDTVPEVSMGGKTDPQIIAEILAASGVPDRLITGLVPKALATAETLLAQGRSRLVTEGRVHPGVRNVLKRLDGVWGVRHRSEPATSGPMPLSRLKPSAWPVFSTLPSALTETTMRIGTISFQLHLTASPGSETSATRCQRYGSSVTPPTTCAVPGREESAAS